MQEHEQIHREGKRHSGLTGHRRPTDVPKVSRWSERAAAAPSCSLRGFPTGLGWYLAYARIDSHAPGNDLSGTPRTKAWQSVRSRWSYSSSGGRSSSPGKEVPWYRKGAEPGSRPRDGGRPLQCQEMDPDEPQGNSCGSPQARPQNWEGRGLPFVKKTKYALRGCCKRFTGKPPKERNRQFGYIQMQKERFVKVGNPVLSVDSKKKELIGNFAHSGRTWRQKREEVNCHDFRQDASALAVPYGLYDPARKQGHVRIGISHDTSAFAVATLAHWWNTEGQKTYPGKNHLLLLCDSGGSNSCRRRTWKSHLQQDLADPFNLTITVCHFPTGASKWNPVEHRLFGPISINWAGEPLRTLGKMLCLIRGTKGVSTTASHDRRHYETGEKISNARMSSLNLEHHAVCPLWNYTIKPRAKIPMAGGP